MPKVPNSPKATSFSSFNDLASQRGDGLHPLLLAALNKFGSVSGPPPQSEQTGDNVICVDFKEQDVLNAPSKVTTR